MIEFTVPHPPVGQPRHRISTHGPHARMYLPVRHPVHAFKKAIKLACGKPVKLEGAIEVIVHAWFPRPKSKVWKTKAMTRYHHTSKPDADNVLKAVLDALNGIAWIDDAQITSVRLIKMVCGGDESARCFISIRQLKDLA